MNHVNRYFFWPFSLVLFGFVFLLTFLCCSQNKRASQCLCLLLNLLLGESEGWRTAGCQQGPVDSRRRRGGGGSGAEVTISRQRYGGGELMGLTQGGVNLRRAGGELNMIWGLQPRGAESEQPCDDPPQCFRARKQDETDSSARYNSLNV